MYNRIQVPDQPVRGIQTSIMRHAFWTVAFLAFVYALVALFAHRYGQFAVVMALFIAATLLDLYVHRRGRYRDRSAVLLFAAVPAIAVTGVLAQVGVTA
ncbi:hypothetical protein [Mycobacteroides franklinii]|uniref:hypothetical protein n=1 Tax=Mycobacteroides franklinii TaxID=948102 RepID=UPI0019D694AD|nr:membrane protein [Mycobacteroides franklinii]